MKHEFQIYILFVLLHVLISLTEMQKYDFLISVKNTYPDSKYYSVEQDISEA